MDKIKLAAPDGTDYVIYCACGEQLETYINPNKGRIEVYCQACIDGAADIAISEVSALNAQQPRQPSGECNQKCAECPRERMIAGVEQLEFSCAHGPLNSHRGWLAIKARLLSQWVRLKTVREQANRIEKLEEACRAALVVFDELGEDPDGYATHAIKRQLRAALGEEVEDGLKGDRK